MSRARLEDEKVSTHCSADARWARLQLNNEPSRSYMYAVASVASIQVVAVFERDCRVPASGRGLSDDSGHAPSVWEQSPAYFSKILITYFSYLAGFLSFRFGWVVNNTFFCCVTNSEHILISLYMDFKETKAKTGYRNSVLWGNLKKEY